MSFYSPSTGRKGISTAFSSADNSYFDTSETIRGCQAGLQSEHRIKQCVLTTPFPGFTSDSHQCVHLPLVYSSPGEEGGAKQGGFDKLAQLH